MNKKKIVSVISIFLISIFFITGCSRNDYDKYEEKIWNIFDTFIVFSAYTKSEDEFNKYYKVVDSEFNRLHKLYDQYNDYEGINNIKTVNDNAGIKPVKVDDDLLSLIIFSKDMAEKYSIKTNIAFGSVLRIWHDYRTQGQNTDNAELPSMDDLKKASSHTKIEDVVIDEEEGTVFLKDKEMSLDIGATSKGYASQLVIDKLKEAGCESAILNAGGNIVSIGKPMEKSKNKWGIGIQSPDSEKGNTGTSIVDTVFANDISVVTSGDYQRFYEVDGKRYNHIIDPDTLMPAEYFKAVTVLAKDSGVADYFSTTLYLMPIDEGKKLLSKVDGVEAIWIDKNDEKVMTKGMDLYLESKGAKSN